LVRAREEEEEKARQAQLDRVRQDMGEGSAVKLKGQSPLISLYFGRTAEALDKIILFALCFLSCQIRFATLNKREAHRLQSLSGKL